MLGALIKDFFAQREGLDKKEIVSVAIMPCTAKKFESAREEMSPDYVPDVDYVLTTRELAQMIKMFGINIEALEPDTSDTAFGERTTAGKLFGASGGVMEAAIRTAYHFITGDEMPDLTIKELRDLKGSKSLSIKVKDLTLNAAVVSGLGNARKLLNELKANKHDLHFIEVMTCPGGCIAGGGQPFALNKEAIKKRMNALYKIDRDEDIRVSYENSEVKRLYDEYLGEPLSVASHRLLHTHYKKREVII